MYKRAGTGTCLRRRLRRVCCRAATGRPATIHKLIHKRHIDTFRRLFSRKSMLYSSWATRYYENIGDSRLVCLPVRRAAVTICRNAAVHCRLRTAPRGGTAKVAVFRIFPFSRQRYFLFFFFFCPSQVIAVLLQKEYRRPFRDVSCYTNSFNIEMPIVLYVLPAVLAHARLF